MISSVSSSKGELPASSLSRTWILTSLCSSTETLSATARGEPGVVVVVGAVVVVVGSAVVVVGAVVVVVVGAVVVMVGAVVVVDDDVVAGAVALVAFGRVMGDLVVEGRVVPAS